MTIKRGVIQQITNPSESMVETTVCTIIEKTEGAYVERLFRKDSREIHDGGVLTVAEYQHDFKVYVDSTVDYILSLNNVYGTYTWVTPLTEVV